MVGRVQLDADAERGRHDFAYGSDDIQDELGALLGSATVGVCSEVGLHS